MLTADDALAAIGARPDGARVLAALRELPGTWIVGGAARDALLAREPRELDVVAEGDPAPLIAALGGELAAEHARFGTATVRLDSGPVDVVRARRESYAHPGALPDVEPGTLEQDLARRDVSVNAIALRPGEAPRAVPGALEDLEAGRLRVLHDASFTDDPTRLWRVARYAARLGFTADATTRELAAAADPDTVSGPRLGSELRLALAEPDPLAALRAARALNPRLLPAALSTEPAGLDAALALLPGGARADLVTLAACAAPVDAMALVDWLDALGFGVAERDVVAAGSRASTYGPLRGASSASEIARAARGAPIEVVALAGGENARRWIDELRHVALDIDGRDLLAAGVPEGPELGARLQRALDARLDGAAATREEQLAVALEGVPRMSFAWRGEHLAFTAPGGQALFTTRAGGVSRGPYASLNLGANTDDDADAVADNRRRAAALAGVLALGAGVQVHGTDVVDVADARAADGRVTTRAGVGAMVLTADCLPVALIAPHAVAMVHAGWKGLAAGVIENGLRALGEDAPVTAAIGPGAGPCCYEVGPEVFAAHGLQRERGLIDLKGIAAQRLRDAGVHDVHDAGICTICDERFFSHRRDAGVTGRQGGIAWRS